MYIGRTEADTNHNEFRYSSQFLDDEFFYSKLDKSLKRMSSPVVLKDRVAAQRKKLYLSFFLTP